MVTPLPDVDQAFIDFLKTHPSLVPLHGGRVGTRLQSTSTAVRIASLGGAQPWPWEGQPEYQVEWWGGTDAQAKILARVGEAELYDFLGPVPGGRITGVVVNLMQLWSPEETTGRPRFITHVQYTTYPEVA